MTLPNFFVDNSESDKFEEIIDFFLSWTIRCADSSYENEHKIVHEQSKKIVSNLIFQDSTSLETKKVHDIKVWKQSSRIDLWVEMKIDEQNYAIIIETKMYSSIRENQLQTYKSLVEKHYSNKPDVILKFVLIRPDYGTENKETRQNEIDEVNQLGYKHLNLEAIKEDLEEKPTGNELFDEFWYNW